MSDPLDSVPFATSPGGDIVSALQEPGDSPTQAYFGYSTVPGLVAPPTTPVILQSSPYHEYSIVKMVWDHSGLVVSPVQGPIGTPSSVTRECAPWGEMIVRWSSKRVGLTPLIPSRDLGDANAVYMKGWVSFAAPGFFVDGTPCTEIEGCYWYQLRLPYAETDQLLIGAAPYTNQLSSDNTFNGAAGYLSTIAGPNLPPAGAPTNKITF